MLVSVNLLIAGLMISGYGQFGFSHKHQLQFFEVSPSHFKSLGSGPLFEISGERQGLNFSATNRFGKVISFRPQKGAPLRQVFELGSSGFSMEYREGFRWEIKDGVPPFLTWFEGSVGPGVSTPPSKWVLLSWGKPCVPILILFSNPASLMIEEVGGRIFLKSNDNFSGWVRIRSPFGNKPFSTSNARELGELSAKISPEIGYLEKASPKIIGFEATETPTAVIGNWKFDAAGSILPEPIEFAQKNGLAVVISKTESIPNLPGRRRTSEVNLIVKFNCGKPENGRAVCLGALIPNDAAATVAFSDPQSVFDAVSCYWSGNGDFVLNDEIKAAQAEFYRNAKKIVEPVSNLGGYFLRDGTGSLLASCYAFFKMVEGNEEELEGLLGSVSWLDWLPIAGTEQERVNSAGVLSVASAMSESLEIRILGAMLNIGAAFKKNDWVAKPFRSVIYFRDASMLQTAKAMGVLSPVRLISGDVLAFFDGANLIVSGTGENVEFELQGMLRFGTLPAGVAMKNLNNRFSFVVKGLKLEWRVKIPVLNLVGIPKAGPSPRYNAGRR